VSDFTSTEMPGHLSPEILSALIDGELAGDDLANASQHLASCAACTSRALHESLLRRSAARAGQRYTMPESFEARIARTITLQQRAQAQPFADTSAQAASLLQPRRTAWARSSVWAGALAALLLVSVTSFVAHDVAVRSAHSSALLAETVDEHIAAMAAAGPQVISTDRHTVKPWFQGKLPFSFDLPATLPPGMTLDGANLVQLNGAPGAQLLFSIGKHHASIFLRQRNAQPFGEATIGTAERNGFHVEGFRTSELDALAVSDADPARLHDLAIAVRQAQSAE
jgi:anti-sigma factor RsiW